MTTVVNIRTELAAGRRRLGGRVAVVMTMGALHDGHVELMRAARRAADHVVVTVFVNPLQFGVNEDFDRYPRTLDDDIHLCIREGVDLVFAPDVAEMYPNGQPEVHVSAGSLGDRLEGQHRPGHFDGVLTVVAKLLHLIRPDVAVFGAKDAQQLALIRRMVADLDLGVELLGVETVREPDGLARSSRNRYLDETDRAAALAIPKALQAAVDAAAEGPAAARVAAEQVLADEPALAVDYVALVDDASWLDADEQTGAARLLVAARVGTTRLIDNVVLHLGTRAG